MSTTELIREAYIAPIRSVMVVDDEYPTMAKLLSSYDEESGEVVGVRNALQARDKNNLLEVIDLCRDGQNNWMLDVHDGDFSGQEADAVNNLHHSDLLILDYHLEGNGDDGRGEQALKILSSLAQKEHFNLVVVHTKGYGGANGDYDAVFNDIVFELQNSKVFRGMPSNLKSPVEKAIDIWAEEQENILSELVGSVSDFDYLRLHESFKSPLKIPHVVKELRDLGRLFESRPMDEPELETLQLKCLIWFVLCEKGANLGAKFGTADFNGFKWRIIDGNCNWVKTENLFVTVIGKDVPTSELPTKLLESLESWRPHPNRLLMAKLRHQLDEKGASVANSLITRQHVQAGWLKELLISEELFSEQKAWGCIQNHMEELSYSFKNELCEYLSRLINPLSEASKSDANLELKKLGIDPKSEKNSSEDEKTIKSVMENSINQTLGSFTPSEVLQDSFLMFKEVNAFNNSIAIEGTHLVTGHVLKNPAGNFLLVVTPACDLVPGRSKHGKIEIQVQFLYPSELALKQNNGEDSLNTETIYSRAKLLVNTKKLLFLPLEDGVRVLSSLYNVYGNSEPKVSSIIIDGDGVWDDERKLKIYESVLSEGIPRYKECEYRVVAQLRYEYALHHSKVSGEYHSRIGLGYQ